MIYINHIEKEKKSWLFEHFEISFVQARKDILNMCVPVTSWTSPIFDCNVRE